MIVCDGGDFVPGPDDTLVEERGQLMLETMEIMAYDAVGVGELELLRGPGYLERAASVLPLVCANLKLHPDFEPDIPPLLWFEEGDRKIAVTGYVDPMLYYLLPGTLDRNPDSLLVLDPVESLLPVLEKARTGADIVIVLAHAEAEQITDLMEQVGPVDVVVQGHEPPNARQAGRVGNALLILPGPRSRQVAQLHMEFCGSEMERFRYRVWDLKRSAEGDARIEALVTAFEERHGTP